MAAKLSRSLPIALPLFFDYGWCNTAGHDKVYTVSVFYVTKSNLSTKVKLGASDAPRFMSLVSFGRRHSFEQNLMGLSSNLTGDEAILRAGEKLGNALLRCADHCGSPMFEFGPDEANSKMLWFVNNVRAKLAAKVPRYHGGWQFGERAKQTAEANLFLIMQAAGITHPPVLLDISYGLENLIGPHDPVLEFKQLMSLVTAKTAKAPPPPPPVTKKDAVRRRTRVIE